MHRPHPALMVLRGAALVALGFSMATVLEYFAGAGTFCDRGGGCHEVARAEIFGGFLPFIGVWAFTVLFVMSSLEGRRVALATSALAVLGGVGALAFIYVQGVVIGAWCWLCLMVDVSALVAAGAGGFILIARVDHRRLGEGVLNPWWALFWIAAIGPLVYAKTAQDPSLPAAVEELYDESADVNIVEMADFECPHCRAMHPVLRDAIEEAGGDVHLVRVVVPLSFHEHARDAARAYHCAGNDQEAMADALFASADLTRAGLAACAVSLNLEAAAFEACLERDATDQRVEAHIEISERADMQGLPSVYIGDWSMVGFDPSAGSAPYVAAIAAARRGAGRRIRYGPIALMLSLSIGSLVVAWRAGREHRA